MQHNMPIAEQMQRLLEPLSPSWVAQQLGVTPQHVNHWKQGRHVSETRLEEAAAAVRQLLPETPPGDPPPWAADLQGQLDQLMTRTEVMTTLEGVEERVTAAISGQTAEQLVDQFVDRMLADLREHAPQLFAGAAPSDAQSAG